MTNDKRPSILNFGHSLKNLPVILVAGFTFLLLGYISYAEVIVKYVPFQEQKMQAQINFLEKPIATYLNSGLLLEDFGAYETIGENLINSDEEISFIKIENVDGEIIYSVRGEHYLENEPGEKFEQINLGLAEWEGIEFYDSDKLYRITKDLISKQRVVGKVIIENSKEMAYAYIHQKFQIILAIIAGLVILFGVIAWIFDTIKFKNNYAKEKSLKLLYLAEFFVLSAFIIYAIIDIYQFGAIAKNRTIGKTLATQFSYVMSHGIELDSLSGINRELKSFQIGNNDIDLISINKDGIAVYHSGKNLIGLPKINLKNFINISHALKIPGEVEPSMELTVSLRKSLIYQKIFESIKTFIVLFVSCLLIAFIFLNAGTAIMHAASPIPTKELEITEDSAESHLREALNTKLISSDLNGKIKKFFAQNPGSKFIPWFNDYSNFLSIGKIKVYDDSQTNFNAFLDIIKPLYFLIVFINALSISFLPKLISELIEANEASSYASTSLPFTLFYLFFALVMVPAGHYGEKGHIGKLLYLGFIAECAGLLLVAFFDNFWIICLGRALSGSGQGLFLIGLQLYVMVVTPKQLRNIGNSIKVIGRNVGLIAGTAIGALLYSYMGYKQIFMLASLASLVSIAYLKFIVPSEKVINATNDQVTNVNLMRRQKYVKRMLLNIFYISKDPEFLRTLFCIGIIGKIAVAGFIMFMLPLIMYSQGFKAEDVGLALMLFYISGILATNYTKKFNVSLKTTSRILFTSATLCGVGFIFFGMLGVDSVVKAPLPFIETLSKVGMVVNAFVNSSDYFDFGRLYLYLMIFLVGISNGFLSAPVMTHVTISTRSSNKYTSKNVLTTYTFLERFGHAIGPILGLQLFFLSGNSTLAMSVFGIFTALCGLGFVIFSKKKL